jgi:hypothetical protein
MIASRVATPAQSSEEVIANPIGFLRFMVETWPASRPSFHLERIFYPKT